MASKTPKKTGKVPAKGSARGGVRASAPNSAKPQDVVLVHGVTEDGKGYRVLRQRDERIEVGALRPVEHGKSLSGDLVKLTPRTDSPLLFDVSVEHAHREGERGAGARTDVPLGPRERDTDTASAESASRSERKGPAQVVSPAYRSNWNRIWGSGNKKTLLN